MYTILLLTLMSLIAAEYVPPVEISALPAYSNDLATALIPFSNDADYSFPEYVPMLCFSVQTDYSPLIYFFEAVIDTGSTGIAISAKDIGLETTDWGNATKGYEYLSSSHRLWEGYWIPARLDFSGTIAAVPILAVTQNSTCANFTGNLTDPCANRVNVTKFPIGIKYMGVGFGRGNAEQPQALPDKVPFTNIVAMANSSDELDIHQGYLITNEGVQVGLTAYNTRNFAKAKLALRPNSTANDWQMVDMAMAIDDSAWNHGSALFDTGISQSYVRVDEETYPLLRTKPFMRYKHVLEPGSVVRVSIGIPPVGYFKVIANDTQDRLNPALGQYVVEKPSNLGPFINTGRFFYYSFDVMLDAEYGWFGLKLSGSGSNEWGMNSSQHVLES